MRTKYPDPKPGDVFNRLTCIAARTHKAKNGNWMFDFLCSCGTKTSISKHDLFKRNTQSCGCFRKDKMRGEPGAVSFRGLYDSCRQAAKLRDMEISLTPEEHKSLVIQDCHYCGSPPKPWNFYVKKRGDLRRTSKPARQSSVDLAWINANGVDRVDSSIGYHLPNCRPCCADCNRAKWELSESDFIAHMYKIVAFQESKKGR